MDTANFSRVIEWVTVCSLDSLLSGVNDQPALSPRYAVTAEAAELIYAMFAGAAIAVSIE